MNKIYINLIIEISGLIRIYEILETPKPPKILNIFIERYLNNTILGIQNLMKIRYPNENKIQVKVEIVDYKKNIFRETDDTNRQINKVRLIKIMRLVLKTLSKFRPKKTKIHEHSQYYSTWNMRKHLSRDCKNLLNLGYVNILIIGIYSHETFDDMGQFDWKRVLDRTELSKENLKLRNNLFGIDFVTTIDESSRKNFDIIIEEAEIVHICELKGQKKYKIGSKSFLKSLKL